LTLGQYPFTAARATMTGNKNLTDNTLYYIKAMSFSADIPKAYYQEAKKLSTGLTDIPTFSMFMQADANSPLLKDPIVLQDFFQDQEFKLLKEAKISPNRLSAFFRGTLNQTANLAGINEINLTMEVWVQEVTDDNFIDGLKLKYPRIARG
jgi:hypothetical protein